MAARCAPVVMKALIAASSVQTERVQKVSRASRKDTESKIALGPPRLNADRNAATKNAGRYFHDLTRKRVIETNGMGSPRI